VPAVLGRRRFDHARTGLAGVLLAFLGLASLYAFTVPGFSPADETSHVGQAYLVAKGELPRLDTATPDVVPGMALYFPTRRELYTANHPPLYYGIVGVPIRLGVATDRPLLGFEAARLLTAAMAAVAAVATFRMASVLLPGRRELHVLAAGLAVLLPLVPRTSGTVYNDGFALAVFSVLLAVAVELLVRGPRRSLLVLLVAAAVASSLTRSVGLGGVALAAVVAVAAHLAHRHREGADRWLVRGLAWAGGAVGAAALASGWFWARNHRLYGDVAGSSYNLERFGYFRKGSTFEFVLRPDLVLVAHRRLWGKMYDLRDFASGWWVWPGILFVLVVLGGAVLLAVRVVRRRRAARAGASDGLDPAVPPAPDLGTRLAWLLLLAWSAAIWVSFASYAAAGGGQHPRYLFPALPALAVLAAAAIGAWSSRRTRWTGVLPAVLLGGLVVLGLQQAARFADLVGPQGDSWAASLVANAHTANDVAGVFVWAAVAMAVAGGALVCRSLVQLGAEPVADGAQAARQ
jgi:hypothetical protein